MPRNSRTHSRKQLRQIARSIESFGFTNPVLVDAGGEVIAGHDRLDLNNFDSFEGSVQRHEICLSQPVLFGAMLLQESKDRRAGSGSGKQFGLGQAFFGKIFAKRLVFGASEEVLEPGHCLLRQASQAITQIANERSQLRIFDIGGSLCSLLNCSKYDLSTKGSQKIKPWRHQVDPIKRAEKTVFQF